MLAERSFGGLMLDYDGDGERDLIFAEAGVRYIRFGDPDDEYTEPEPTPAVIDQDLGSGQSFDVDGDGGVEFFIALAEDDGRVRWQALGWGQCP